MKTHWVGRLSLNHSCASLLALDASEGMVVGVLGAWGSGKTSFVNLARVGFADEDVTVLDFNPWMFSGAEQLVESFFVELAAQLKVRPGLADVANDLADYGEAFAGLTWLPLVGPWIAIGVAAQPRSSARFSSAARVCVVPEDLETAIITKHVYRISVDRHRVLPAFLMQALRGHPTVRTEIQQQTRPGINGQIVKQLRIAVPPLDEQREILRRVDELLAVVTRVRARVSAAAEANRRISDGALSQLLGQQLEAA